jgi:hypothetical protein
MTGILQTSGDGGGFVHCALCGGLAAGPCARCKVPVCGDCCVLTEGSAQPWAICLNCNGRKGSSLSRSWLSLGLWLLMPLVALVVLIVLLQWAFGP